MKKKVRHLRAKADGSFPEPQARRQHHGRSLVESIQKLNCAAPACKVRDKEQDWQNYFSHDEFAAELAYAFNVSSQFQDDEHNSMSPSWNNNKSYYESVARKLYTCKPRSIASNSSEATFTQDTTSGSSVNGSPMLEDFGAHYYIGDEYFLIKKKKKHIRHSHPKRDILAPEQQAQRLVVDSIQKLNCAAPVCKMQEGEDEWPFYFPLIETFSTITEPMHVFGESSNANHEVDEHDMLALSLPDLDENQSSFDPVKAELEMCKPRFTPHKASNSLEDVASEAISKHNKTPISSYGSPVGIRNFPPDKPDIATSSFGRRSPTEQPSPYLFCTSDVNDYHFDGHSDLSFDHQCYTYSPHAFERSSPEKHDIASTMSSFGRRSPAEQPSHLFHPSQVTNNYFDGTELPFDHRHYTYSPNEFDTSSPVFFAHDFMSGKEERHDRAKPAVQIEGRANTAHKPLHTSPEELGCKNDRNKKHGRAYREHWRPSMSQHDPMPCRRTRLRRWSDEEDELDRLVQSLSISSAQYKPKDSIEIEWLEQSPQSAANTQSSADVAGSHYTISGRRRSRARSNAQDLMRSSKRHVVLSKEAEESDADSRELIGLTLLEYTL